MSLDGYCQAVNSSPDDDPNQSRVGMESGDILHSGTSNRDGLVMGEGVSD